MVSLKTKTYKPKESNVNKLKVFLQKIQMQQNTDKLVK